MELYSPNIYMFSKESFAYILANETLHFSIQARKIKNNLP